MQIQDLLKAYQAKSDEELVRLAAASDQLTSDANLALQSELSRRQIKIAEDSGTSQNVADRHEVRYVAVSEGLQAGKQQGVGDFVAEVLRTYHRHFWLFFKITAPAVIISTIAIIAGRNEMREIERTLLRGLPLTPNSAIELLRHRTEMFEIYFITFSEFLVSWILFSFSYGATCIAVDEIATGFTPSAWPSFLNIRERLGPFLRLCLLLFFLVLVAEETSMLLVGGAFWALHKWQMHLSSLEIWVVSYGIAGLLFLVISRFALAVPAVILDHYSVGQSLFRSDELTRGKWLTLAALLAKSLIGGYVAGMCPFWLAPFIRISTPSPSWFPWSLTVASIIGVSVVEPTMFVGFALLYLKMSTPSAAPNQVLASQLA